MLLCVTDLCIDQPDETGLNVATRIAVRRCNVKAEISVIHAFEPTELEQLIDYLLLEAAEDSVSSVACFVSNRCENQPASTNCAGW